MASADNRLLTALAWINVVLHLAGLGFAVLTMRPGTPAIDLDVRRAYLAAQPLGWSLGWGTWMLCALAQVAFYAALAPHLPERIHTARLAVALAAAGMGIDLFCDALYITVLPTVAAGGTETEALFRALERLAMAGGLIVANGLYVLATFLLTLCLRGRPGVSPLALAAGYGVFGFGLLLTAAGFTGVPWHAEAATGPTILSFCAWVVLVARALGPSRKPS